MPVYSRVFTTPASTTKDHEMWVEGYKITHVRLRLPPGSFMLLHVALFYGEKQIFPWEEGTYFAGNDEIIEWDEDWILPETPCRIIVHAENEDDTYEHSVLVTIVTQTKSQTLEYRLAKAISSMMRAFAGYV